MNKLIIFSFAIFGLLISCEKSTTIETLDPSLVIGDSRANLTLLDTAIFPYYYCNSILYELDIDIDGDNDFQFYVYYCYDHCTYESIMKIDCLSENCKILSNDSIQTPEILEFGDTVQSIGNWISQSMDMLSTSGLSELCYGDGIIYTYGNWHDLTNKCIGVMIEKEENIILGWIKLSINKTSNDFPIDLHEIGYKKAAYKSQ